MRMWMTTALTMAVLVGATVSRGDDAFKPAPPAKEHEWLKQLEGDWVTDAECVMFPGAPPMKWTGTESAKSLGGFWVMAETKAMSDGTPFNGFMTVGFDVAKKKYVGTWVCSMDGHLWKYEGALDEAGQKLTLNTEGPNPADPGTTAKMRDVVEMKDKDHKTLTSYVQGPDGEWVKFMTIEAKRKK
ncbi:MAG: DUF1579 domain-containing protein [Planctomycetia bacterium]